ncbi:MAG: retropepsin-like aspartic protease [Planctomycetota bacterium]
MPYRPTLCIFTPACAAAATLLLSLPAAGQATREFGRADGFAIDQPRAVVSFTDPNTSDRFPEDATTGFTFIADTGASGVLLAAGAHLDLFASVFGDASTSGSLNYPIAGNYFEQGVGGFEPVDVTQPLDMTVSAFTGLNGLLGGSDNDPLGNTPVFQITNTQGLDAPDLDLGSFDGIVGMPAMNGRTVVVDLQTITGSTSTGFEDLGGIEASYDLIHVGFHDSNNGATPFNAAPGTQHTFSFSQFPIDAAAGQDGPTGPLPSSANLPLLGGIEVNDSGSITDLPFLFDTGAQLTLVSSDVARANGIDPLDPTLDSLAVSGVGGTVEIPVALINSFTFHTNEGNELRFTDVPVGIIDIPGLDVDGILGFNFFTTGYLEPLLEGLNDTGSPLADENGAFLQMLLDFEDPNDWGMTLVENALFPDGGRPLAETADELSDISGAPTDVPLVDPDGILVALLNQLSDPNSPIDLSGLLDLFGDLGDEPLFEGVFGSDLPDDLGSLLSGFDAGIGTGLETGNQALLAWPGTGFSNPVPEPTAALVLIAGAPLLLCRRRGTGR